MADVRLTVLPESAQVAPGGLLSLALTVHNDSRIVDRYHLTVAGVPEDWTQLEKTEVSLFPGASERLGLTVHPTAGTGTTAGDYGLTVQATSENDSAVQVSVTVAVTVAAVGGLGLDVLPAETEGRNAIFRVTLLNGTNADAHLILAARDSEEGLRFAAEPSNPLTVPAGGQIDVTVLVSPRSQPLFGRAHPYEIEFRAPHADDTTADPFLAEVDPALIRQARYTYLPRSAGLAVPPWLRRLPRWLFILLLLLLILLLVLAQRRSGSQQAGVAATPTPVATATHAPGATPAHPATPAPTLPPTPRPTQHPTAKPTPVPRPTAKPTPAPRPAPTRTIALAQIKRFAVQVGADGALRLAWAVSGAGQVQVNGSAVSQVGSRALSVTKATTLVLTARNAGGTVTQLLRVVPPARTPLSITLPPVTMYLPVIDVTATSDPRTHRLSLMWRVSDAVTTTVNGAAVAANGSRVITPDAPRKYVLRATNALGSVQATVILPALPRPVVTHIAVAMPTIDIFTLGHAGPGQPYTLLWQARNASAVSLDGHTVPAQGSRVLPEPLRTKTYHLLATNDAGRATASVEVRIGASPPLTQVITLSLPEILAFGLRRTKNREVVRWRVREPVRVWLQGVLTTTSGEQMLPHGITTVRLLADNDVGQAQRVLPVPGEPRRVPPTGTPPPSPVPTATARPHATARPTATPTPRPRPTRIVQPTPTRTPRPTPTLQSTPTSQPTATSQPTPTQVVVGTGLRHPFGVAVGPNGDYYVADAGHNRIVHFDARGGYVGSFGQPASLPSHPERGDLSAPAGVVVDKQGVLLVVDLGNARVARFRPDGTYLGQIGGPGTTSGSLIGPEAVAVAPSGTIYVLDTGANRVDRYNVQGHFTGSWGGYGSSPGEFHGPSGIALDTLDNVYVADTNNNRVQEFSADGRYLAQWGQAGTGTNDLRYPTGIAVDATGTIWVGDMGNSRVVQIQHPSAFRSSMPLSGARTPIGVAVAGARIYIVDVRGERVLSYNAQGVPGPAIGAGGHGQGQLSRPQGLAVDGEGNVYVADTNNNRIQKFTSAGVAAALWGQQGRDHQGSSPRFLGPQDVAVDRQGAVYVADTFNSRIQKLDADGNYVWERRVGGQPRGIAVDSHGNVYVTSYYNQHVLKFDAQGTLLTTWGGRGRTNGLFMGPSAITVDAVGRVYVADTGNARVVVFSPQPDGSYAYTAQFGGFGTGSGQFAALGGLATGPAGLVYAVDSGARRLNLFSPYGAQFTSWGTQQQLYSLTGLALDAAGNVVTVDTLRDQLIVYTPAGGMLRRVP